MKISEQEARIILGGFRSLSGLGDSEQDVRKLRKKIRKEFPAINKEFCEEEENNRLWDKTWKDKRVQKLLKKDSEIRRNKFLGFASEQESDDILKKLNQMREKVFNELKRNHE